MRGITIGPIENARHPGKGYGTEAYRRTLQEIKRWGATWVSLTPYGRIFDLSPSGIDMSFEAPFEKNRQDLADAIRDAHALGLRVLMVPHLWVETGGWRGDLDPGDMPAWARWADSYRRFILAWARVAQQTDVDMFSVGVELRSWVTTPHAPSFIEIIDDVRRVFRGPLTYSANWDDINDTVILGHLDIIGINGFYPLAHRPGETFDRMLRHARDVASKVRALSVLWRRPVVFTEIGYTSRKDPALNPWEWPDSMRNVRVDQQDQATAYRALLAALLDEPTFMGFFVWRLYADPDDMSQEAEWGFSPRGKLAELVVRDAFSAYWYSEGDPEPGHMFVRHRSTVVGVP